MPEAEPIAGTTATGVVERVATAVIEGNSHFYLTLAGDSRIYDCALPGLFDVLVVREGDTVTLVYQEIEGSSVYPVESIELEAGGAAGASAAGAGADTGGAAGAGAGAGGADASTDTGGAAGAGAGGAAGTAGTAAGGTAGTAVGTEPDA
jgi:hypothetical protein